MDTGLSPESETRVNLSKLIFYIVWAVTDVARGKEGILAIRDADPNVISLVCGSDEVFWVGVFAAQPTRE